MCITQNVFDYTWNTKKISILWDIQKQDSRFYPYYYNKCILVETNPFYPYVMKGEIINIYKIINNIPTNIIQYPNEWNVIYETSDEYMLKNSKYTLKKDLTQEQRKSLFKFEDSIGLF